MLAVPVERRVGQGIIAIEKAVGAGKVAQNGKRVTVQFSGQRSTGVAIPSGEMTFRLGVGEFIRGFDYGVAGMKVGGIRSLKVPKDMTDQKGKDLEYVTYQVELIDVL
jgi:FKBP-type peptidyl-prolyl cis-trans isomerase